MEFQFGDSPAGDMSCIFVQMIKIILVNKETLMLETHGNDHVEGEGNYDVEGDGNVDGEGNYDVECDGDVEG